MKQILRSFLIISTLIHQASTKMQILQSELENEYPKCINTIFNIYNESTSALALLYSKANHSLIDNIVKNAISKESVIINLQFRTPSGEVKFPFGIHNLKFKFSLIITQDYNKLYAFFTFARKYKRDDSYNLIVYTGNPIYMKQFFQQVWVFMELKSLVIDGNGNIYIIQPFSANCDNRKYTKLTSCQQLNTAEIKQFYENDIDFSGCNINFATKAAIPPFVTTHNNGFETMMIKEAANIFNFNIGRDSNIYIVKYGGIDYDKDPPSYSLYPYFIDYNIIAVPLATNIPNWLGLFYVFDNYLWIAVIAIIVLYPFICNLILKSIGFFNIFAIFMGQGVKQPNRLPIRYLFIAWTFFTFIILNAYSGLFASFLINPLIDKQIDSIDDIIDAKLPLYYKLFFAKEMRAKFGELFKEKFVFCKMAQYNSGSCFEDVVVRRNATIVSTKTSLDFFNKKIGFGYHSIYYNLLMKSMHIRHGQVLKPLLNKCFQRFIEVGLVMKWIKDVEPIKINQFDEGFTDALAINNLWLILFIYTGGMIVAIIVFLFEFCIGFISAQMRVRYNSMD